MGLQVGDVVRLAGGGPAMTVVVMEGEEAWARCYWFTPHNHRRVNQANFPPAALVLVGARRGEGVTDGGCQG